MELWKGISWDEAMRIWWLLVWRGMLLSSLVGFLIGLLGGFIGLPSYIYISASAIAGAALVWPIIFSQMLRKQFKGFRLEIIRETNTNTTM